MILVEGPCWLLLRYPEHLTRVYRDELLRLHGLRGLGQPLHLHEHNTLQIRALVTSFYSRVDNKIEEREYIKDIAREKNGKEAWGFYENSLFYES